jgi:hypothetical protein
MISPSRFSVRKKDISKEKKMAESSKSANGPGSGNRKEKILLNDSVRVKVCFNEKQEIYVQAQLVLAELGWDTDAATNGGVAVAGMYYPEQSVMEFGSIRLDQGLSFLRQHYHTYCFTAIKVRLGTKQVKETEATPQHRDLLPTDEKLRQDPVQAMLDFGALLKTHQPEDFFSAQELSDAQEHLDKLDAIAAARRVRQRK